MRAMIPLAMLFFMIVAAEVAGAEHNGQENPVTLALVPLPAIEAGGTASSETLSVRNYKAPVTQSDLPKDSDEGFHTRDLLYRLGEDDQAELFPGLRGGGGRRDLLYRLEEDSPQVRMVQPRPRLDFPSEHELDLPRMRILPERNVPGFDDRP